MTTRARRDGDDFVLDGAKIYITSAEYAGVFVVWAVTDPERPKGKGISCFLVEAGTPGLVIGKAEEKMGQHGSATNIVHFENCRVPASALMGRENDGFRIAVGELAGGRIGVAALSLGIARAAMDAAKSYVLERRQFDQRVAGFPGRAMDARRPRDRSRGGAPADPERGGQEGPRRTVRQGGVHGQAVRLRGRPSLPPTRRSSFTAAQATAGIIRSSASPAMRASPASTRERRRSSG